MLPKYRFTGVPKGPSNKALCSHRDYDHKCRHDDCFILSMLNKLHYHERYVVSDEYSRVYLDAGKAAKHAHQRTCSARTAANQWLTNRIKQGVFNAPKSKL